MQTREQDTTTDRCELCQRPLTFLDRDVCVECITASIRAGTPIHATDTRGAAR